VIVAVEPGQVEPDPTGADVDVRCIGAVGGDRVLGIGLDELSRAHVGDA
jgi:hypothetical protein